MASTDIVPSKMIADIKAIGIDLASPGDLSKMDMSKKKKLMPFFVKALGHVGLRRLPRRGRLQGRHAQQADGVVDVEPLRQRSSRQGGGALFCDSCHQGKQKLLDRSDKKALSKFMIAELRRQAPARRQEGPHLRDVPLRPFEGKIFAKLWKVAP